MRRPTPLPMRSHAEVVEAYPAHRQSRLGDFDQCRLMTRFGLEGFDYSNPVQARGILFHRVAAEVLRTLWQTGEQSMPVSEALEVMYEVCAQRDVDARDVVTVPSRERRLLRLATIGLVYDWDRQKLREYDMRRLATPGGKPAIEHRLFATVRYPNPETGEVIERQITGQPDALLVDPPNGAVVLDWKTTPSPPPKHEQQLASEAPLPSQHEAAPSGDDAVGNVSYMGYFQQRVYALLVMARFPSVERVTLREFYVLANEARTATVEREGDLEHVERELANLVEQLDAALMAGAKSPLWTPQPGKHCAYCPKPRSCPIEDEVRIADGGIVSASEAERVGGVWIKSGRVRKVAGDAAKAWHEETGRPIAMKSAKAPVELRWGPTKTGGGRRFDLHPIAPQDPPDARLDEALDEAKERVVA
jgi:hypothetical protein